ncbi:hypothetical protein AB0L71_28355 [Streptomyces sp. NPDC052052]|uniref:hypothetical protein n=1 Tax=Streptomyces sp. NPDC052052 TaxID=3154756 RepID=UPI0034126B34
MSKVAHHIWLKARGLVLAVLGVAAAYALSLALDGLAWQAGLGLIAFLTTVLTVGVFAFRMHPDDALEEAATAVRAVLAVAFAIVVLTATFLTALTGSPSPTT